MSKIVKVRVARVLPNDRLVSVCEVEDTTQRGILALPYALRKRLRERGKEIFVERVDSGVYAVLLAPLAVTGLAPVPELISEERPSPRRGRGSKKGGGDVLTR